MKSVKQSLLFVTNPGQLLLKSSTNMAKSGVRLFANGAVQFRKSFKMTPLFWTARIKTGLDEPPSISDRRCYEPRTIPILAVSGSHTLPDNGDNLLPCGSIETGFVALRTGHESWSLQRLICPIISGVPLNSACNYKDIYRSDRRWSVSALSATVKLFTTRSTDVKTRGEHRGWERTLPKESRRRLEIYSLCEDRQKSKRVTK
jgi:hypothetical protein